MFLYMRLPTLAKLAVSEGKTDSRMAYRKHMKFRGDNSMKSHDLDSTLSISDAIEAHPEDDIPVIEMDVDNMPIAGAV